MTIVRIGARRAGLTIGLGMLVAVAGSGAAGARAADLPVGNIVMPPVTPEQAQHYLDARVVPTADAVPVAQVAKTLQANAVQTSASANQPVAAPVLGHDLPEGDTTPFGLKRADFTQARATRIDASSSMRPDAAATMPRNPGGQTAHDAGTPPALPPLVIGTP